MGKKILPEISTTTSLSIHNQNINIVFPTVFFAEQKPQESKERSKYRANSERDVLVLFEHSKCSKLSSICT